MTFARTLVNETSRHTLHSYQSYITHNLDRGLREAVIKRRADITAELGPSAAASLPALTVPLVRGRNFYSLEDITLIIDRLERLDGSNARLTARKVAEDVAAVCPRHTKSSYQTFISNNLRKFGSVSAWKAAHLRNVAEPGATSRAPKSRSSRTSDSATRLQGPSRGNSVSTQDQKQPDKGKQVSKRSAEDDVPSPAEKKVKRHTTSVSGSHLPSREGKVDSPAGHNYRPGQNQYHAPPRGSNQGQLSHARQHRAPSTSSAECSIQCAEDQEFETDTSSEEGNQSHTPSLPGQPPTPQRQNVTEKSPFATRSDILTHLHSSRFREQRNSSQIVRCASWPSTPAHRRRKEARACTAPPLGGAPLCEAARVSRDQISLLPPVHQNQGSSGLLLTPNQTVSAFTSASEISRPVVVIENGRNEQILGLEEPQGPTRKSEERQAHAATSDSFVSAPNDPQQDENSDETGSGTPRPSRPDATSDNMGTAVEIPMPMRTVPKKEDDGRKGENLAHLPFTAGHKGVDSPASLKHSSSPARLGTPTALPTTSAPSCFVVDDASGSKFTPDTSGAEQPSARTSRISDPTPSFESGREGQIDTVLAPPRFPQRRPDRASSSRSTVRTSGSRPLPPSSLPLAARPRHSRRSATPLPSKKDLVRTFRSQVRGLREDYGLSREHVAYWLGPSVSVRHARQRIEGRFIQLMEQVPGLRRLPLKTILARVRGDPAAFERATEDWVRAQEALLSVDRRPSFRQDRIVHSMAQTSSHDRSADHESLPSPSP